MKRRQAKIPVGVSNDFEFRRRTFAACTDYSSSRVKSGETFNGRWQLRQSVRNGAFGSICNILLDHGKALRRSITGVVVIPIKQVHWY